VQGVNANAVQNAIHKDQRGKPAISEQDGDRYNLIIDYGLLITDINLKPQTSNLERQTINLISIF
jgi:hypothetical protein